LAKGKYGKWLEPDNLILLEGLARRGLVDRQIAHNMGISEQTLNVWKKKHPLICESLKKGKEVVDIEVENALLKRAMGYSYDEVSEKYENGILTERKITTKHVVADTTAQIFWLKNRQPELWRDRVQINNSEQLDKLDDLISSIDKVAGK
jgi:hypothetical protein